MNTQYNFEGDIRFLTGRGALRNATIVMGNMGCRKLMLICDEESLSSGQYAKAVRKFNRELNIAAQYKRVKPIATAEDCDKALQLFKEKDCDSILALGQKSAIFVAKAVKIMLKDNVSFTSNYLGCAVNDISSHFIPLIVAPTYLSSGVEASNFVRLRTQDDKIIELNTPFAQTNVLILDPCLCDKTSAKEIASSGLCALAMAIASLTRGDSLNTMVKVYALNAITLLTDNFKQCLLQRYKLKHRFKVALAAILAGSAYWYSPDSALTKLTDLICDVSGANYNDVFNILFANGVKSMNLKSDFDGYDLVNLIGYNEYVDLQGDKSGEEIIKASVKRYYTQLRKYVSYPRALDDLGIDRDMLDKIMQKIKDSDDVDLVESAEKMIFQRGKTHE